MKGYTGWARCPGTCGEWVQGANKGIPFLIGCPINRYVKAWAEIELNAEQVWDLPPGKTKTRLALEHFTRELKLPPFKTRIRFSSQLSIGKGMASSTADMVAALGAVAYALDLPRQEEEIARLSLMIEPTDPVMFPQITEFAHRDGSYLKHLEQDIKAHLLILDWGGVLDTESFNARGDLREHYAKTEKDIKKALALFYEGMAKSDLGIIAQASTISARCNQEINPKPAFEAFLSWVRAHGGLGVITAHSGTLLAGVFPEDFPIQDRNNILKEAKVSFRPELLEWVETCQGGIEGGKVDARRKFAGSPGALWQAGLY